MGSSSSVPKDLKFGVCQVALKKTCFAPGEVVYGYVDLEISRPIRCKQVNVDLKGESLTTVHYITETGNGNEKLLPQTAREIDIHYNVKSVGCSFANQRTEVGHYQIPFQLKIPAHVPSTAIVPLRDKNAACMMHMIVVSVVVGKNTYYIHSVPIQITSLVDTPINTAMMEDSRQVNFLCCINRG